MDKPLAGRTISTAFVRLLHEYLHAQGADAQRVLGGPVPETAGFPIARWVELLERAARHLHDRLLGLHLGRTITPRHLGTLGYLLQSMPTLGAALWKLENYQRLVYDQTPLIWLAGPDHVDLTWGPEHGLPGRLADDTSITALIHYCRLIARGPATPLRVQFINNRPPDMQPYIDAYGCPVEFGASVTSVRYSTTALGLPLRKADAELSAMMERQAGHLLALLPEEAPIIEQVRREIARLLHDGEPGLPAVAAGLGLASRTAQRRLNQAGSSFRRELETVRRLLAETYLRDGHLSVADVAQLLGYSEHSALTRSYRQWTGLTPQRWRESAGPGKRHPRES